MLSFHLARSAGPTHFAPLFLLLLLLRLMCVLSEKCVYFIRMNLMNFLWVMLTWILSLLHTSTYRFGYPFSQHQCTSQLFITMLMYVHSVTVTVTFTHPKSVIRIGIYSLFTLKLIHNALHSVYRCGGAVVWPLMPKHVVSPCHPVVSCFLSSPRLYTFRNFISLWWWFYIFICIRFSSSELFWAPTQKGRKDWGAIG